METSLLETTLVMILAGVSLCPRVKMMLGHETTVETQNLITRELFMLAVDMESGEQSL